MRLLPALLLLAACGNAQPRGPFLVERWVPGDTLTECDRSYEVYELPWEVAGAEGWETPNEALARFGTQLDLRVDWAPSQVADTPELVNLDGWRLDLSPHPTLPPLWAGSNLAECPALMVVPLGVSAASHDGQLQLVDSGERRVTTSWNLVDYPPWSGWEHSALIVYNTGDKLGLRIEPDARLEADRVGINAGLLAALLADRPTAAGEVERLSLRLDLQGGRGGGWMSLGLQEYLVEGGLNTSGLGAGDYVEVQP